MCAINARADAAGPASGARDELARTMSSLIMSANAPKIFRSRGSSIATSICARSIDSKPYPSGSGRQACGEKAGLTKAYDAPPMTRKIETPLFRSSLRTECRYLAAIDRGALAVASAAVRPNHIFAAPASRCGPQLSAGPGSSLSASHLNRHTLVSHDRASAEASLSSARGWISNPCPSRGRVGLEHVSRSPRENGCVFGRRMLDRPCRHCHIDPEHPPR